MSAGASRARVTIESRRLWSLRASLAATRWLLYAAALAGIAATVRNAVAPRGRGTRRGGRRRRPRERRPRPREWFALRFARAYLTWSAPIRQATSARSRRSWAPAATPTRVSTPAPRSARAVAWEAIAGERARGRRRERDYTVAVATRRRRGALPRGRRRARRRRRRDAARYPALVGAPAPAPAGSARRRRPADRSTIAPLAAVLDARAAQLRRGLRARTSPPTSRRARASTPVAPGPQRCAGVERLAVDGPRRGARDASSPPTRRGDRLHARLRGRRSTQLGGRWEITRIELMTTKERAR